MSRRRLKGRPVEALVDDRTGTTIATFQDGAKRVYSRAEIADYVVEVAHLLATGHEDQVSESWFEFLSQIVGRDVMERAMLVAAIVPDEQAPPGLRIAPGPAAH